MAAVAPQWTAANVAVGSLTNTGDDGSGGGGQPPRRNQEQGHHKGGVSEREKQLNAIREALMKRVMKNPFVTTGKLSKNFAKEVLEAYEEMPEEFKSKRHLKNGPNRQWMGLLSSDDVVRDVLTVSGGVINFGGGACYLPTVLATSQGNAVINGYHNAPGDPDNRCRECRERGSNRFSACVTFPGAFYGACVECAFGNHYETCSFSNYTPDTRSGGQGGSSAQGGRNRSDSNRSMNSAPPSPASAISEDEASRNQLPASGDRQRVDWARDFLVPGSGSRRGQAVINFNYSQAASRQEAIESMAAAIRRVADDFEDAFKKGSQGYRPDRYQPPRND